MTDIFTVRIEGITPEAFRGRTSAGINRAANMAGTSALRAMRAEGSRAIRERKRLKVTQIGEALTTVFPTNKQQLIWKLRASGSIVPVISFPARQTRRGVVVEINVGSQKLIRGAFIATMHSGHRGVFMRQGKARLPIKEAFTTRVSEVFRDSRPTIAERGRSVFNATFKRVLPIEMAKVG